MEVTDIAIRLEGHEEHLKHIDQRIEEQSEALHALQEDNKTLIKLASSVENLANNVSTMNEKVDQINEKQDKLAEKVMEVENAPAMEIKSRWDGIMDKIIWLIVGGAITVLLQPILSLIK